LLGHDDYFTAITGNEWPKGKRVWEWDGQWAVPSPLHCHGVDWNRGGDTLRNKMINRLQPP